MGWVCASAPAIGVYALAPTIHESRCYAEARHGREDAKCVLALLLYKFNEGAIVDAKAIRLLWEVEGDEACPTVVEVWKNMQRWYCWTTFGGARSSEASSSSSGPSVSSPIRASLSRRRLRQPRRMGGTMAVMVVFCTEERIRMECVSFFHDTWVLFHNAAWI